MFLGSFLSSGESVYSWLVFLISSTEYRYLGLFLPLKNMCWVLFENDIYLQIQVPSPRMRRGQIGIMCVFVVVYKLLTKSWGKSLM